MMDKPDTHLSVLGLGLAIGVTWALGVFFLGLTALYSGFGAEWVELIASVYRGFEASWGGAFVGAIWALVDGFIAGVLVGFFYNLFSCCCFGKCRVKK